MSRYIYKSLQNSFERYNIIGYSPLLTIKEQNTSESGIIIERNLETLEEPFANKRKEELLYPDEVRDIEVFEGAKETVAVNKYERDQNARRLCLVHYGSKCIICGFNAKDTYGVAFTGKIHVHHLISLSNIGQEYKVDPIKDLRPVCPNCHMIIHSKKDGTYSIDEVKRVLKSKEL